MAAHSYIQTDGRRRGSLLDLNMKREHTHQPRSPAMRTASNIVGLFTHYGCGVAPLNKEECCLLVGISSNADRYEVYSTPGKLEWGIGLKVGDTVLARLPDLSGRGSSHDEQYTTAIIRWCGRVHREIGYLFGVEITDQQHYGRGNSNGREKRVQYFTCEDKCGMFLMWDKLTPPNDGVSEDPVSPFGRELREKTQENHNLPHHQLSISERRERETVTRLQGEVRDGRETVTRLQGEVREESETVTRLQGEVREERETVTRLQENVRLVEDSLSGQRECHVTELRHLREESEQYQRQLKEEQNQRQQLSVRIDTSMTNQRGEVVVPQALELWELPREDVHISQTILGTGAWGYVAQGTFRGQAVAVKCLHRTILSPQNEGRVRREISIMTQIRHPNLLLLIGAVLTTEGTGPLIVTELLDMSLRSAYENGVLEERSKAPVLRDVSSALFYLHSHRTPIIHRDVSSANVLLEAVRKECWWKAKLSDFGSANLSHLATTPQEGAAVYSAPEVSTEDRSRQTAKIDVYSFGVLMCEVCLCRFPPERREFPSMLSDVHRTSPDMFQLSRDCTSHTPQDRPTMREVLAQFQL